MNGLRRRQRARGYTPVPTADTAGTSGPDDPLPEYGDTSWWGPRLWRLLLIAEELFTRETMQRIIRALPDVLPCEDCRKNFGDIREKYPDQWDVRELRKLEAAHRGETKLHPEEDLPTLTHEDEAILLDLMRREGFEPPADLDGLVVRYMRKFRLSVTEGPLLL